MEERVNISFIKPHGEQGEIDHTAIRSWIHSDWPSRITEYPPSCVFNVDEAGIYFRALPEHTMDDEKRKLLAIRKSKYPGCFKGVKNLPVDYTANSNTWMTKEIFTEWLTKWDNEIRHNVLLLIDKCTTHVVTVKFTNILTSYFYSLTLHQSYNRVIRRL
ncbi:DDE superfamily endonuclease domain [Cinara cedri]|uniref:DDE superfamily endonuclease domain n=1 Tax=Cinara cedri TaxID=506608 RepID=A0A5E4N0R0_9HEMI|nr:DDE superfamily endonuclease domain [Cinara cedri]